jgi:hypothetical protein
MLKLLAQTERRAAVKRGWLMMMPSRGSRPTGRHSGDLGTGN